MKLLAGAKLLVNNGDYRVFSRPGGYAQARADFEALGLSNIKKTQVGLTYTDNKAIHVYILHKTIKNATDTNFVFSFMAK